MTDDQWRAFVSSTPPHTGKLATVRRDGSPQVVPVWFVLDGDDVVFTCPADGVKGRIMRREGRAALCVDHERGRSPSCASRARCRSRRTSR